MPGWGYPRSLSSNFSGLSFFFIASQHLSWLSRASLLSYMRYYMFQKMMRSKLHYIGIKGPAGPPLITLISRLLFGLLTSGLCIWMQDCFFTSQFRLHDFQPPGQSISFGDGYEVETLSSFLQNKGIYLGLLEERIIFQSLLNLERGKRCHLAISLLFSTSYSCFR